MGEKLDKKIFYIYNNVYKHCNILIVARQLNSPKNCEGNKIQCRARRELMVGVNQR